MPARDVYYMFGQEDASGLCGKQSKAGLLFL